MYTTLKIPVAKQSEQTMSKDAGVSISAYFMLLNQALCLYEDSSCLSLSWCETTAGNQ